LVPTNPILGQRILREISRSDENLLLTVYSALGAHLVSYVNRDTIIKRTPEARLAGRLFDYDEVVTEFIPSKSEAFYLSMKRYWGWNSRYWEQFALLKLDYFFKSTDKNRLDLLRQAISHARHAITIEKHPLGLTTLGKILLEDMRNNPSRFREAFDEAFDILNEAIVLEGKRNRIAIHPYMTLYKGVSDYLRASGSLYARQLSALSSHLDASETLFSQDKQLQNLANDLRKNLKLDR
jgi:hypothetical protein